MSRPSKGARGTIREIVRVALALIRIPRLFGTLFLFPLVLSFVFVLFQAMSTFALLSMADQYSSPTTQVKKGHQEGQFVREKLLRVKGPLPPIKVCRWESKANPDGSFTEQPPNSPEGCSIERYDIVLRIPEPESFDASQYQARLNGKFLKIHVCRFCRSDIIITPTTKPVKAHLFSVWGLILLSTARRSEQVEMLAASPDVTEDNRGAKLGKEILNLPGLYAPTALSDMNATIVGILNVASLIIIAAWLAMKAHRKVLDYFAASGVLLPLVAASGRSVFYGALWVLTAARVFCFLLGSAPFCYYVFTSLTNKHPESLNLTGRGAALGLWLIALVTMFSLATTVASISELRTKHSLLSFVYRYIPFALCALGGAIWAVTLLIDSPTALSVRNAIAALPLIGMIPVLLAPIFVPNDNILVLQSILSMLALVFAVRSNIRWFGAHLEEL